MELLRRDLHLQPTEKRCRRRRKPTANDWKRMHPALLALEAALVELLEAVPLELGLAVALQKAARVL